MMTRLALSCFRTISQGPVMFCWTLWTLVSSSARFRHHGSTLMSSRFQKWKRLQPPADTRPISILPAISKFVEKLVQHQLVECLETYHLMSEQQHGHREHRSTETALAVIADRVHQAMGRGDISNLTLLDQSKGSVIVPRQTLLDKLSTNGINTKWFHNYLEGHTQQVVMRRTDWHCPGIDIQVQHIRCISGRVGMVYTLLSNDPACTRQRVSLQYSMPTMSRLS